MFGGVIAPSGCCFVFFFNYSITVVCASQQQQQFFFSFLVFSKDTGSSGLFVDSGGRLGRSILVVDCIMVLCLCWYSAPPCSGRGVNTKSGSVVDVPLGYRAARLVLVTSA